MPGEPQPLTVRSLTVSQEQENLEAAAKVATVEAAEAAEATKDRDALVVQLVVQSSAEAVKVKDAAATVASQARVAEATSAAMVAQMAGAARAPQEASAASKVDVVATAHLREELQ